MSLDPSNTGCGPRAPFRVLVGDVAPELGEIVCAVAAEVIGDRQAVQMTLEGEAEAILTRAEATHFDLVVIVLNNVLHGAPTPGVRLSSLSRSLQVVARLRKLSELPMVVLSGSWRQGLEHEAEQAGADIFFQLPFAPEKLREQLALRLAVGT